MFLAWWVGELGWPKLEIGLRLDATHTEDYSVEGRSTRRKKRHQKALPLIWKNFQSAGDVMMYTEKNLRTIFRFQKHNNIP